MAAGKQIPKKEQKKILSDILAKKALITVKKLMTQKKEEKEF